MLDRIPGRHVRIVRTLYEMCEDRGYVVDASILATHLEQDDAILVKTYCESQDKIMVARRNNEVLLIFYFTNTADDKKLGKTQVVTYWEMIRDDPNTSAIIVHRSPLTPEASSAMLTFSTRLASFTEAELMCNPTRHSLYVRHIGLNKQEASAVYKKYTGDKYPVLNWRDVIRRYFGWLPGTLVQIHRRYGDTHVPVTTYRVVGAVE